MSASITETFTTRSMDEPYFSRVFLMFSRVWRVSAARPPGTICFVAGSVPSCPERYSISPTRTASEKGAPPRPPGGMYSGPLFASDTRGERQAPRAAAKTIKAIWLTFMVFSSSPSLPGRNLRCPRKVHSDKQRGRRPAAAAFPISAIVIFLRIPPYLSPISNPIWAHRRGFGISLRSQKATSVRLKTSKHTEILVVAPTLNPLDSLKSMTHTLSLGVSSSARLGSIFHQIQRPRRWARRSHFSFLYLSPV